MLLYPVIYTFVAASATIATAVPSDPSSLLKVYLGEGTEISFGEPDSGWREGTLAGDALVKRIVGGKEQKYVSAAEGEIALDGLDKLSQPLTVNFTTWVYDAEGTIYRGKFVNQCMLKSVQGESQSSEVMQIGPYSPPKEGIYGPVQMNCTDGDPWRVPKDDGALKFYDGRPLVPYVEDGPYGVAIGKFKGLDKDGRDKFRLLAEYQKPDALLTYECVISVKEGDRQSVTSWWGFGRNDTDGNFKWDNEIRGGVQAECELRNSTSMSMG